MTWDLLSFCKLPWQEQVAKMFPRLGVNRRSCSIKVHSFKKSWKLQNAQSLLDLATVANHVILVADQVHQSFLGLTKTLGFHQLAVLFYIYIYIYTYIYIYGCESKCKVWIMLRAHMCSRPTIQTSDPDPFRGNDPDVMMIQTEHDEQQYWCWNSFWRSPRGGKYPQPKTFRLGIFSKAMLLLCGSNLGQLGVQFGPRLGNLGSNFLVAYVGLHGGLRGGENTPNRKLFGWGYFLRPCWCYVGPIVGQTWGPTSVHFGRFVGLCRAPWQSLQERWFGAVAKVWPWLGPDHEPYETPFVPGRPDHRGPIHTRISNHSHMTTVITNQHINWCYRYQPGTNPLIYQSSSIHNFWWLMMGIKLSHLLGLIIYSWWSLFVMYIASKMKWQENWTLLIYK